MEIKTEKNLRGSIEWFNQIKSTMVISIINNGGFNINVILTYEDPNSKKIVEFILATIHGRNKRITVANPKTLFYFPLTKKCEEAFGEVIMEAKKLAENWIENY
jgi:hypothetical protein